MAQSVNSGPWMLSGISDEQPPQFAHREWKMWPKQVTTSDTNVIGLVRVFAELHGLFLG